MTLLLTAPLATATESHTLALAVAHAAQAGADARMAPMPTAMPTTGPCTILGTTAAETRRRTAKYLITRYEATIDSDNGWNREWPGAMPATLGEILAILGDDWTEEDGFFQGPIEQDWCDYTGRLDREYRKGLTIERLDGAELGEKRLVKIKEMAGMDV